MGDNADLRNADLRNADLRNADLRNADLRNADIQDGVTISKQPIQIATPVYCIIIYDSHMQIGCKIYTLAEWWGFDNRSIAEMDGKCALKWWGRWKAPLQAVCEAEGRV